jgi:hypothetical protein
MKVSGQVTYRVVDEHGLGRVAVITFLHATRPVVPAGECPLQQPVEFDAPIFVGKGDQFTNLFRYEIVGNGEPHISPRLEQTGSGPVLGEVRRLLVDPDDPQVLYALAQRELWVSLDAGRTFRLRDSAGLREVEDLVVTGGEPGYLWAVSADGVFRAERAGGGFQRVLEFGELMLSGDYTIAVHPQHPARLLVTGADGTWRSDDAGSTWRRMVEAPTPRLQVDPTNPNRVYSAGQDGVYLSRDFGETWEFGGTFPWSDVLVVDPVRPGRLYVGPYAPFTGLRVSDDQGGRFRPDGEITGQVRGLAFSSTGAAYVAEENRVVCRPLFEDPRLDPDHPLTVELVIEDADGLPLAETPVHRAVQARMIIGNRSGRIIDGVTLGAWMERPEGRLQVFSESDLSIGPGGLERVFSLPAAEHPLRHRLVVTADMVDDAPAGAVGWFVATEPPPTPVGTVEYARLEFDTLWLNLDHPWFPIHTAPGEQRRTVLDITNEGPNTARNVVVEIATGSLLSVDDYGPVYLGQSLRCRSDMRALTCELGDLAPGATWSLELYVTPRRTLSAVPVYLRSDTPASAPPSGGLDLVTALEGPEVFEPGEVLEYVVTVTNGGDLTAESGRIEGAIGPWAGVRAVALLEFSDPACRLAAPFLRDEQLTYTCSFSFLNPEESLTYRLRVTAPEARLVSHVVSAIGFPGHLANPSFELNRGNNSRGRVSERRP